MPETAISIILEAASFAADKHRMQRRKDLDASPYINHPLSLAYILSSEGGVIDAVVIASALLHDTVEDTGTTVQELGDRFGPDIAHTVAEVTDDKSLPKEERKRLQVLRAGSISAAAKLVKLADKIGNLRDITARPPPDWTLERRREYFQWAREVVGGLRGINPALERAFDEAYAAGMTAISAVTEK
jgi:guanosine-3',5'-bis(diphosphate) 3'-pyrophosphohydrolase